MRRLTLLFVLATSVLLLTGCGTSAQSVDPELQGIAQWLDDGYFIPTATANAIWHEPDEAKRKDLFVMNAKLIQKKWAIDRESLIWLMQEAAKGRQIP